MTWIQDGIHFSIVEKAVFNLYSTPWVEGNPGSPIIVCVVGHVEDVRPGHFIHPVCVCQVGWFQLKGNLPFFAQIWQRGQECVFLQLKLVGMRVCGDAMSQRTRSGQGQHGLFSFLKIVGSPLVQWICWGSYRSQTGPEGKPLSFPFVTGLLPEGTISEAFVLPIDSCAVTSLDAGFL